MGMGLHTSGPFTLLFLCSAPSYQATKRLVNPGQITSAMVCDAGSYKFVYSLY